MPVRMTSIAEYCSLIDKNLLTTNTELAAIVKELQKNPLYNVPFGDMSVVADRYPNMTIGELGTAQEEVQQSLTKILAALELKAQQLSA